MTTRLAILCALLATAGCHKQSGVTSGPATPEASADDTTALLAQLTQLARKFGLEQRRAPKTLDELVALGYLPTAPQAPAGKKFAINKNLEVYLANP